MNYLCFICLFDSHVLSMFYLPLEFTNELEQKKEEDDSLAIFPV